jgi:4-methyl-5(b-hydroxyethyl)-thiazole monophosphate biosynthesis
MFYIFLAEGFEECEALVPLDILRRANIEIKTVGIGGNTVTGAHGIKVVCDTINKDLSFENLEGIILPGGMPGTLNLEKDETVQKAIDYCVENNLIIAAICAAPSILGHKNLLSGKKATCFPGFEKDLLGAEVCEAPVVRDGNIITSYGAGAAFEFGFEILAAIKGKEFAYNLQKQMKYK